LASTGSANELDGKSQIGGVTRFMEKQSDKDIPA
jgi:hypothetical protein